MSDSTIQLSLFDTTQPEFSERIRRVEHNGETVYSLVDIMAEFVDSKAVRQYWADTKKRLKADGFQVSENILQLKLVSTDGKAYKTDVGNAHTCLRIVQSIPSPKAEPIRQWFASLAVERMEEARNPGLGSQRARIRDLELLQRAGYSQHEAVKQLAQRIEVVDSFKSLMATVSAVVETPNYREIASAECYHLFSETIGAVQRLLNTKQIRDSLPALQISYLKTAELSLELAIKRYNNLTMDQLVEMLDTIYTPLGEHLRTISTMLGIHPITGKPLLAKGE